MTEEEKFNMEPKVQEIEPTEPSTNVPSKAGTILKARCVYSGRRWILWKLEDGQIVLERIPGSVPKGTE